MAFVKLDCSILDSSLWAEDSDTRIVWITLLAMADCHGVVESTAPGIARRAAVPMESAIRALELFEAPDRWNKDPNGDGRRLERIDCGYQIVNYGHYRKKDHSTERVRDFRAKSLSDGDASVSETECNKSSVSCYASASASVVVSKETKRKGECERETARQYVAVFNATFERKLAVSPGTLKNVTKALARGFKDWQVVAQPLMVAAQGIGKGNGPEVLVRDGQHQRRARDGYDCGGFDWLTSVWERADQTKLDGRLSAIAHGADKLCPGLVDGLKRLGVTMVEDVVQ